MTNTKTCPASARTALMTWMTAMLIMTAGCEPQETTYTGSGTIEATEVDVSSGIPGEIIELDVDEGDPVKKGQRIARIDTRELELERAALEANRLEIRAMETQARTQVNLAKTALQGAEKSYHRALELRKKGSISQQKFDEAETAWRVAQRKVETASSALELYAAKRKTLDAKRSVLDYKISQGVILAPLDGWVIVKSAERGERVLPARPMVTIGDLSSVWVKIYLGETDLGKVKLGGQAHVYSDTWPDRRFQGRITWISDKSEFTPKNVQTRDARADLVYAVKITIPNPDRALKIGMPVDVNLEGFPEYSP